MPEIADVFALFCIAFLWPRHWVKKEKNNKVNRLSLGIGHNYDLPPPLGHMLAGPRFFSVVKVTKILSNSIVNSQNAFFIGLLFNRSAENKLD